MDKYIVAPLFDTVSVFAGLSMLDMYVVLVVTNFVGN